MTVEVRQFGDGKHLVVFTDHEPTRTKLKMLPGYVYETFYFVAHKLVAADVYIDKSQLPAQMRNKMLAEARQ